jgi:hypothetical protein
MQKIPCLIIQDHKNKTIPPIEEMQINPVCQWVMDGEGVPTRKWDGTACAVINGKIYARFNAKLDKKGNRKPIPEGSIPCEEAPDPNTGHWPHWRPAQLPEDKYVLEAFETDFSQEYEQYREFIAGLKFETFEAVGPKINGNKEHETLHRVYHHKTFIVIDCDTKEKDGTRTLKKIAECLAMRSYEGIVFHHEDGRMAKIRRKDFGLRWPT